MPSDHSDSDTETKAIDLWVAAANAAVKSGETPPVGGWHALPDDLKQHYRTLAGAIHKSHQHET
jgi:hypothetical protein